MMIREKNAIPKILKSTFVTVRFSIESRTYWYRNNANRLKKYGSGFKKL